MVTATEPEHTSVSPLVAAIGSWQLDSSATTVEISTKAMWGLVRVKGTVEAVSGYGTFSSHGAVDGALVIAMHTLDTNNVLRDRHLRGKDFFDVDRYPTLTYVVTHISTANNTILNVGGALTIKGRSRPTDLTVTITEASRNRFKLSAEVEVDRSAWGISGTAMGAGRRCRVVVLASFTRVGPATVQE